MVRKEAKGHGAGNQVEGRFGLPDGSKVTMIEDTVTTGGSLLKAINAVEAAGLNVVQVLCVVDRCEGVGIFEAAGYTLEALVTRRHHLRCMMLSPEIHAERRAQLARTVDGPILLVGNGDRPRNLPMSTVAFRQDSSFLCICNGCTHAGAAVTLIDGRETLYLPVPAEDDALWHGVSHTIEELGAALGFQNVRPSSMLETDTAAVDGIATIAIPDLRQTQRASQVSGMPLEFGSRNATPSDRRHHPDAQAAIGSGASRRRDRPPRSPAPYTLRPWLPHVQGFTSARSLPHSSTRSAGPG